MDRPIPLALQPENVVSTFQASPVLTESIPPMVSKTSPNSAERSQHETALNQPSNVDPSGKWKAINTTVIGDHEIPHRISMHIPVSVPKATVGCDICFEGPSRVKRLVVESTLNRVREGHKTALLVANTCIISCISLLISFKFIVSSQEREM